VPLHREVVAAVRRVRKVLSKAVIGGPPTDLGKNLRDNVNRLTLIGVQAQEAFAREGIPLIRNVQEVQDNLTDLVAALPGKDRPKAVNQVQELLDIPFFATLEAMIRTLEILESQSQTTIKNIRKDLRK